MSLRFCHDMNFTAHICELHTISTSWMEEVFWKLSDIFFRYPTISISAKPQELSRKDEQNTGWFLVEQEQFWGVRIGFVFALYRCYSIAANCLRDIWRLSVCRRACFCIYLMNGFRAEVSMEGQVGEVRVVNIGSFRANHQCPVMNLRQSFNFCLG